jgi:hypothetical protein
MALTVSGSIWLVSSVHKSFINENTHSTGAIGAFVPVMLVRRVVRHLSADSWSALNEWRHVLRAARAKRYIGCVFYSVQTRDRAGLGWTE